VSCGRRFFLLFGLDGSGGLSGVAFAAAAASEQLGAYHIASRQPQPLEDGLVSAAFRGGQTGAGAGAGSRTGNGAVAGWAAGWTTSRLARNSCMVRSRP
jgi:hypothetical protein